MRGETGRMRRRAVGAACYAACPRAATGPGPGGGGVPVDGGEARVARRVVGVFEQLLPRVLPPPPRAGPGPQAHCVTTQHTCARILDRAAARPHARATESCRLR